ncbi:MAG: ribosome biogenesis GTPase Der [Dehalococcoidia bacterium]|uniref:ribosome biogenesis GTPase Der n=1 Tax=Candidatus Amarobacter glycogenicus TaxID=3140699 RepID=UPI0031372944|nr:ribosome biogenesis GTPase Der [Dehalococcoidia bacterium]
MTAVTDVLSRVVIVGRPNVGKSSLFNRVYGERRAIVEDEPGTTRDRVEADVEWQDVRFRLIDTGGYETDAENVYAPLIVEQIKTAMDGASVVLFCVDARDGLTASDYDMAEVVRRANRPTLVVATKADNERRELTGIAEASSLGLGEPMPVSAMHDINVGLLLDEVIKLLPADTTLVESDRVRVAIIGRPNVGKSMLVNSILGQQRVIVSDVAGTTRDAIDSEVDTPEGSFLLIDTAGIRRPGKLGKGVELHSVMRTTTAVERCDVAVLVVDGTDGVTSQDMHIAGIAMEHLRGLIIAVNKTDLWEDPEERRAWAESQMRGRVTFAPWAMVTFISALTGQGTRDLLKLALVARDARRRRLTTAELNSALNKAIRDHVPPLVQNKRFKLLYATQAGIDPPTFILFVNDPKLVHFSYRRYLERSIREAADFDGTAIKLVFRARSADDARS